MWRDVTPGGVLEAWNASASVDWFRATASQWLEPYSASLDWSACEASLNSMTAANLTSVMEIGEGTLWCLPRLTNGSVFDPNIVGMEAYLAYQYRYARAVVAHFAGRIRYWQIENELNEAFLTSMYGWRYNNFTADIERFLKNATTPYGLFGAWNSWPFLTQLLTALAQR